MSKCDTLYAKLRDRGYSEAKAAGIARKASGLSKFTTKPPTKYCFQCKKYDCGQQHAPAAPAPAPVAKYAMKPGQIESLSDDQLAAVWQQIQELDDFADPMGTLDLPHAGRVTVWKIDGDAVKVEHDMDFVEAGNGYRWPFIPKDEIWLDEDLEVHDWCFNCIHEADEIDRMAQGEEYDTAHNHANRTEKRKRIEAAMTALADATPCSQCGQKGCDHVAETVAKYAVAKYAMKRRPDNKQSSLLGEDDEQTHWITIGGHPGEGGHHVGGVHVEVKAGTIVKGPDKMIGKAPDQAFDKGAKPQTQTAGSGQQPPAPPQAPTATQPPADEPFTLAPPTAPPAKWVPADYGKQKQKTMLSTGGLPGQMDLLNTEGSEPEAAAVAPSVAAPTAPVQTDTELAAAEAKRLEDGYQGMKAARKGAVPKTDKAAAKGYADLVAQGKFEGQLPIATVKEMTPEEIAAKEAEKQAAKKENTKAKRKGTLEAKKALLADRQRIVDELAKQVGVTPAELQEAAEALHDMHGGEDAKRINAARKAGYEAAVKATGMSAKQLESYEGDYSTILGFDVAAGRIAEEYPELGLGAATGDEAAHGETKDYTDSVWDIALAGPPEESDWHDEIQNAADELTRMRDQEEYEAAQEEERFAEIEHSLTHPEEIDPAEEAEGMEAVRGEADEGHTEERTPRTVLEDQAPEEEGRPAPKSEPKAEGKPTEKPTPQKTLSEEMADRQKQLTEEAHAARKGREKEGEKPAPVTPKAKEPETPEKPLKQTAPTRDNSLSMGDMKRLEKAGRLKQGATADEMKAERDKMNDEEAAAKTAKPTRTAKQMKSNAAEKIGRIPAASKARTKKWMEDARTKVEKTDPELAKALSQWIASLADAASPYWDIRNVGHAILRHRSNVGHAIQRHRSNIGKSSSPTRKNATHLPGGRLLRG
jgi:hypothetical protein